jgi:hypothetical protein
MRGGDYSAGRALLRVRWTLGDGSRWHLWANFGAAAIEVDAAPPGAQIYRLGSADIDGGGWRLAGGGAAVSLEQADLG